MLYFKDHFEVRIHSVELVHFSEELCVIFLIPQATSDFVLHTIFRIRWCWEQKTLKCCKIIATLYISNVLE